MFGQTLKICRYALFLKGKKVSKGVCKVAKLATLCISISPTTGWTTGQTENAHCVNRMLIKLVPLKLICVNALTLTALIIHVFFFYDHSRLHTFYGYL